MDFESSLKALKVAELKAVLTHAQVQAPARATKSDLIARIVASQPATNAYHALHPSSGGLKDSNNTHSVSESIIASTNKPVTQPVVPEPSNPPSALPDALSNTTPQPVADTTPSTATSEKPESISAPSVTKQSDAPFDEEMEKRKQRAARFNIPLVEPKTDSTNKRQKKGRGNGHSNPKPASDVSQRDAEQLAARAARFGITSTKPAADSPVATTGQKRVTPVAEVDSAEAERRKKRAERFGTAVTQ